ncbi:MAG: DeoR/GlpR family DNA-binding transcription regulator [Eubacteriales bacterium]
MLPSERQNKFISLLASKEIVTISEFIKEFGISIETVRRDLNILEKEDKIEKVYGGARLKDSILKEPAFENRMSSRLVEKEWIGRKCSEFINDGDCIFIDSGSTTYQISKYIKTKKNLIIITNSIPVINELMDTDFEIIIIGGKIRQFERSIVTYDYMFNFTKLNIQKCFIGAGGITPENGISDFDIQEAATRSIIIKRSKEVFVAADSSKFGKDVIINIAPLLKINYIVTDSALDENIVNSYNNSNVKIILVEY